MLHSLIALRVSGISFVSGNEVFMSIKEARGANVATPEEINSRGINLFFLIYSKGGVGGLFETPFVLVIDTSKNTNKGHSKMPNEIFLQQFPFTVQTKRKNPCSQHEEVSWGKTLEPGRLLHVLTPVCEYL